MQVSQERLDPCQVALTIEVETEKVSHAVDRAYREYARYVSVPGFRKGKAPMHYVRQRIPSSEVRQRTAELLVESAYEEAIKETAIEPYAQPKLELLQLDLEEKPFIFKAVVPLAPEVKLGTYKGLKLERRHYTVSDSDVDQEVERLRQRAAEYPKVERAAQTGDLLIADLLAIPEGEGEAVAEPRPTMIEIGGDNIPGFDNHVTGMSAGDTKTFSLQMPDDYHEEEQRGKKVAFTVTAKEVRHKEIPALNDELATKITNGKTETLDALRADIRKEIEDRLNRASENVLDRELVDQVVAASDIHFPPMLVEAEVDDDYKELTSRLASDGRTVEDYLESQSKTDEQLKGEMAEAAARRVRSTLVLGEIARAENLELTDEDVDAYITEVAEQESATPAAIRAYVESRGTMGAIRNRAQLRKVIDYVKGVATIKTTEHNIHEPGANPEATEAEAPAKGKKKKAK